MGYALKEPADHRAKPEGGYVHVSTFRIATAWWSYLDGKVSLRAVRVLLALHEMGIERSAHVWSEKKQGRGVEFTPRFAVGEIAALCGLPTKRARAALDELLALGLLAEFSPERIRFAQRLDELMLTEKQRSECRFWSSSLTSRLRVPMPRRILTLACEASSPAQIAFILGASLRCIYLKPKQGGFTYSGLLSLAWLSGRFGICLRAVKAAKSHLVELGWAKSLGGVRRFGERIAINPAWERLQGTLEADSNGTNSAPLERDFGTNSAPANTRESSPKVEIQEPRESLRPPVENPGPGLCPKNQGEETPQDQTFKFSPSVRLSAIKPEDFKDVGRALELYRQAVKCGLVPEDSEHSRLRWLAAIERARTVQAKNPAGVFLHIVQNRLWKFLSEGHWDSANERLKVHLYGPDEGSVPYLSTRTFSRGTEPQRPLERAISDDAKLIKAMRVIIRERGLRDQDPLPHLRRHDASWNRERLLAAELELARPNYLEDAR